MFEAQFVILINGRLGDHETNKQITYPWINVHSSKYAALTERISTALNSRHEMQEQQTYVITNQIAALFLLLLK